jgi:cytochrome-b5 reductase
MYALLVPAGLEHVVAASLVEAELLTEVVPPPSLPPGFAAGPAGGVAVLLADGDLLPEAALHSPCLAAALALVAHEPELDPVSAVAGAACLQSGRWTAALCLLAERAGWAGDVGDRSFRVTSLRGGQHPFSSRDLDKAVAGVVAGYQPGWRVSLEEPDVLVLCLMVQVI